MKPLVLICSQDEELYLVLSHILEVDGMESELTTDANELLEMTLTREHQAVILDCQPASVAGGTTFASVKQELCSRLPVVALVARGAETQLLDLFKAGIDQILLRPLVPAKLLDYLNKTIAMGQERFRAVGNGRSLFFGDLQMDLVSQCVRHNGHEIHLGLTEFNLLRHLLENPGKVFSREELINAVWPDNIHVCVRTIDVHISRLRKTLTGASCNRYIRTLRSRGYSLEKLGG